MSFFKQCKQCSVIVDGGSGVLFQPMTENYTYILTAKHNLYNDELEEKSIHDIKYIMYGKDESENILKKYEHPILDIAILKIEKIDFQSPYKEFEKPNDGDPFKFYGYPENIRNETEKIKYFNLKVGDIQFPEIVTDNESYYNQDDVIGCSGGGVFKQDGDNFYLVGIECRMDAQSISEENNTRLRYVFIDAFDKIVEENNTELKPLYPPYMSDFNLLIDNIFLLTGLMFEKDKVTNILKAIVDIEVKDKITPKQIFDKYNIGLLTNDEYKNELINKELWVRYLEFLVLSALIDTNAININEIDKIYTKRKFLFTKQDNWIESLKELFSYEIKSLIKNSIVCISNLEKNPDICEVPSNFVESINTIPRKRMNINQVITNPTEQIKVQHIHNFQKRFMQTDKQLSLVGLNINKIEERIIDEAKKTFR